MTRYQRVELTSGDGTKEQRKFMDKTFMWRWPSVVGPRVGKRKLHLLTILNENIQCHIIMRIKNEYTSSRNG